MVPCTWLGAARSSLRSRPPSLPRPQDAKPPAPLPSLRASLAPASWHGHQPAAAQIRAWRRRALLSRVCVRYPAHLLGEDLGENPDVGQSRELLIPSLGAAGGRGGAPAPNRSQLSPERRGEVLSTGAPPATGAERGLLGGGGEVVIGTASASASAPQEAAGPRSPAGYHLFLIGLSSTERLCLHEGPGAAEALSTPRRSLRRM